MDISFKFDDLKTQRYVNCNELVLECVDDVVDPVDAAIDNLHTTHDRAFGTSADVHGCGSCSLCCKTPVGSVCALPALSIYKGVGRGMVRLLKKALCTQS